MDVAVGLYRVALVVFALVGTRQIYLDGDVDGLAYFTNLTGFAVAVVFAWAGLAVLARRRQPPAWLKGGVTLFATVTGLIAYFVLAPDAPDAPIAFAGLTDGQIEHRLIPVAVAVDFLFFDAHRRMRWRHAASWIAAILVYLAAIVIRGQVSPASGYPYGFVDVAELGWGGLAVNVLVYAAGIYVAGVAIVGVDKLLPRRPILGSGVGTTGGSGSRRPASG